MDSTQVRSEQPAPSPIAGTTEMKLEVVALPVSDVDRAKRFYEGLGWRLDADFTQGESFRGIQMTPPGSRCSIQFGKGVTTAAPGSAQGLFLVVDDVDAARAELTGRGVKVSEVFHYAGIRGDRLPGRDPEGGSYRTWASFSDPDGNVWLLQEIRTRLPGRLWPDQASRGLIGDVGALAELLRETEKHHGPYEATAPKHHWSGWYAAYMVARVRGRTPDEAAQEAALHLSRAHA